MVDIRELQAKADETLNQVRAETDVLSSVKTFIQGQNDQLTSLQKQVEELISSGTTSGDDLQKLSDTIDQIRSSNEANTQALASAIVKDTPAEGSDPSVPTDDTSGEPVSGEDGVGTDTPTDGTEDDVNNTVGGGSPVSTESEADNNPAMSHRRRR